MALLHQHWPYFLLPSVGQGGHFLCLRSIGLPAEEFAIGFGPEVRGPRLKWIKMVGPIKQNMVKMRLAHTIPRNT